MTDQDRRSSSDRVGRLSDDVGLLRGDVQGLTEALRLLNDLRQRQEDTQHAVSEQGDLIVLNSAHVDDTLRSARRRIIVIAVVVILAAAAVSWFGYEAEQSHAAARAQGLRGACEHRNAQAAALDAYLQANVAFDRQMIATEKRNGYVSDAIRKARVASYETVLAGDSRALKAFSTKPLDCAHLYPNTHP